MCCLPKGRCATLRHMHADYELAAARSKYRLDERYG
jgi:hypothetical protein